MKIIFVLEDDLNERYAEKYGINYFLEKNQKVEILNINLISFLPIVSAKRKDLLGNILNQLELICLSSRIGE